MGRRAAVLTPGRSFYSRSELLCGHCSSSQRGRAAARRATLRVGPFRDGARRKQPIIRPSGLRKSADEQNHASDRSSLPGLATAQWTHASGTMTATPFLTVMPAPCVADRRVNRSSIPEASAGEAGRGRPSPASLLLSITTGWTSMRTTRPPRRCTTGTIELEPFARKRDRPAAGAGVAARSIRSGRISATCAAEKGHPEERDNQQPVGTGKRFDGRGHANSRAGSLGCPSKAGR